MKRVDVGLSIASLQANEMTSRTICARCDVCIGERLPVAESREGLYRSNTTRFGFF